MLILVGKMLILPGQGVLMLLTPQHVGFGNPSNPMSNSQLNDKGFVDSGCSRHMSGNIALLLYFKDFDRGYVTFGGGANGGRITGKGTIKTDKLDCDVVYFLPDENQILLKIPKKDNMYSFDIKNIVPKESLTCLVAKATLDEKIISASTNITTACVY
ncbi:hypothetical protein Tco_0102171 [Tanacetum coccineum]